MKKALAFIVVFCLMTTMLAGTVAAASYSTTKPPLSMQILGKAATPAPILYQGKVFVPLRTIGRALGYQVNYGEKSKTMDLISAAHKVTVTIGYINANVNGKTVKMDSAPVLSNNSLYVPLTFIQKNFVYDVVFTADKNMVSISKPGTGSTSAVVVPTTQKPAATAANSIYIMDKKVNNTEKTLVKNGIAYIPVRLVGESLGYKVTWSGAKNTMTLTKTNQSLIVVAGKSTATINNKSVKLDGAPYLSGGRLYAPLSMVSKNMGYIATYDSKQNNIAINIKPADKPSTPAPTQPAPTKPPVSTKPGIANVVNVSYDNTGGFSQVNISADAPMASYNHSIAPNPDRLVVDIYGAFLSTDYTSKEVGQPDIARIRLGQIDPEAVRVVLDLNLKQQYKIVQSEDKKTISIIYANIIAPISYQKEGDLDVITIQGTSTLDTSVMELENPRRIVLDVKRAVFNDLLQGIPASSDLLKAVRIGQYDVGTARVVLDVTPEAYFEVKTSGNTSKIYLSSYPFKFMEYNRNYNTSVVSFSPGKEVQYNVSVDTMTNSVKVVIPQDLRLDTKTFEINDNLVKRVEYATEVENGTNVTAAYIRMQDSVVSEVISEASSKLIKIRFKRNITSMQQLTIVVDPGHGGKDPGAIASDGTREKDLNLDVALKLEKHLNAIGFKTIMTRTNDTFVELGGRTDLANRNYADFFISIHFNAFNQSTNGIETLYYPNSVNEEYLLNNRSIAEIFHQEVLKATARGSRGITARPNLYVLNKTKMPSILSELGFMTNPTELALMKTDKYREDSARALAVSILRYFRDIEGVKIDIDPNSIYTWPYETQVVQPTQPATVEPTVPLLEAQVFETPAFEAPAAEEATVQPNY